jgi:dihydrolipoamide dehydrogenase
MEEKRFDIAVIGGGPGGYPAAIRAAQYGRKVALIEMNDLGGTCLNRGCIPSKALIAGAELWHKIKQAEEFGIHIGNLSFDYKKMAERKNQVVNKVRQGLESLIAANKITLFKGFGKFVSSKRIKITGQDNLEIIADKIIIATGSEPKNMPSFPFDYQKIHNSTSLLDIQSLPKSLVIIGGGVIGCEFASLFAEFGVRVTIVEVLPHILPLECSTVSAALSKAYKKKGIEIETNAFVESIKYFEDGITVRIAGGKVINAEIALVAIGRTLNTSKIGLDAAGVAIKENGMINVNDQMETNVSGIYAVGDIASKWWLAHVASHQGVVAATNAAGKSARMHYHAVPSVIFTHPEIATVGYTLEEAINKGYKAAVGAFPFSALGRSQATSYTEGFAQVVTDKATGQILGAQVVGHDAATLIAEMSVAIANELTLDCLIDTIHAHPTVAEAWLEAAMIANNEPLHMPPQIVKQKKPSEI